MCQILRFVPDPTPKGTDPDSGANYWSTLRVSLIVSHTPQIHGVTHNSHHKNYHSFTAIIMDYAVICFVPCPHNLAMERDIITYSGQVTKANTTKID